MLEWHAPLLPAARGTRRRHQRRSVRVHLPDQLPHHDGAVLVPAAPLLAESLRLLLVDELGDYHRHRQARVRSSERGAHIRCQALGAVQPQGRALLRRLLLLDRAQPADEAWQAKDVVAVQVCDEDAVNFVELDARALHDAHLRALAAVDHPRGRWGVERDAAHAAAQRRRTATRAQETQLEPGGDAQVRPTLEANHLARTMAVSLRHFAVRRLPTPVAPLALRAASRRMPLLLLRLPLCTRLKFELFARVPATAVGRVALLTHGARGRDSSGARLALCP
mmetsp:Transcript_7912/g.32116  ORF Transcript_7912/g.32116 Transcript_7912/m.32116 type:complete len:280 (-) Transcript_7912:228-1067(-)